MYCAHDEVVDIDSVKPNPRNPNHHPEEQIELLAKIIQKQGWRKPITVSTRSGLIVSGHGRLLAAKAAGVSHVPVDFQHYESEEAELADLLADNRLAELSEIDNETLAELFADLDTGELDVDLTGYTEDEYGKIMAALEKGIADTGSTEREDLSDNVPAVFEVIVECIDEAEQRRAYEKLTGEGYECRVLTL